MDLKDLDEQIDALLKSVADKKKTVPVLGSVISVLSLEREEQKECH